MQTYIFALTVTLIFSAALSKRMTEKEAEIQEIESGTARLYSCKSFLSAFAAMIPLTFVVCFRWNVGIDSAYGRSYSIAYHMAALGENARGFEPGYYILSRVFAAAHVPWFVFSNAYMGRKIYSYSIRPCFQTGKESSDSLEGFCGGNREHEKQHDFIVKLLPIRRRTVFENRNEFPAREAGC